MLNFQEIIGHDQIKEHFQKAIEYNKVSHAYILTGEAGMGRKSLANAFALTLLCEKGKTEPCMECHACKQVLSGSHPDLIYVSHEKPGTIGVDDIRKQINDTIMIRPYSSYYKIAISWRTDIGEGLCLGDGMCMVVNPMTKIGKNCNLSQFVNIGTNHNTPAIIGDYVYIGPMTCIVENVHIGNNVTIGAGSVVTKDIPDNATVAGVPARVLNYNNPGRYVWHAD